MGATYIGRFAPSPTGPLHAGSLVAALASWLDARAHGGRWLVRIEDVDLPRCVAGAGAFILQPLSDLGLRPDDVPVWQSRRGALYQQALDRLIAQGVAYPCGCSRKDIATTLALHGHARERHGEQRYPGTCRDGLHGRPARTWRFRTTSQPVQWQDRRLGQQTQDVEAEVGDFVLKRADNLWAYQLAVVVDDAEQGVTDVVRGEDLTDNTARQVLLHRALQLPTPTYLHTPLVLGPNGEKLSKHNGGAALDTGNPLAALNAAAQALGLLPQQASIDDALAAWVSGWSAFYNRPGD